MGTERKTFNTTPQRSFSETDIQESLSLIKQLTFEFSTRNQIKNLPVIDSTVHFVRMFDSLMKGLNSNTRSHHHSVFETLTTQRGSNQFICLMSRYFLLSVGSKIEAFFDERKARTRRVPVPPNKEQKKKRLMSVGDGTLV